LQRFGGFWRILADFATKRNDLADFGGFWRILADFATKRNDLADFATI
jgi:hypothetical protein